MYMLNVFLVSLVSILVTCTSCYTRLITHQYLISPHSFSSQWTLLHYYIA